MSDYGFATYDDKTGRVGEKINSKYPVFGPEYNKIATEYKTIRLVDTTERETQEASIEVPDILSPIGIDLYAGTNDYRGYIDELVYSYEHNMGKRPMGYAIITGNLVRNQRYKLIQDYLGGNIDVGGDFESPMSGEGTLTQSVGLAPEMGGMLELGTGDYQLWEDSIITVAKVSNMPPGGQAIAIKDSCSYAFSREYSYHNTDVDQNPYRVEITDTEVKIYRRTFWYDAITRVYFDGVGDDIYYWYNVTQRVKVMEDFAGSVVDVTVYLAPYSSEDLE